MYVLGGAKLQVESKALNGRFGHRDRGDKMRTETRYDRSNSCGHAHKPSHIVRRRWCFEINHGGRKLKFSAWSIGQPSRKPSKRANHKSINEEKTRGYRLETSIASSPLRSKTPSAHPIHLERDIFLSWAIKNKTKLVSDGAHATKQPTLSSTLLVACRLSVVRCGALFQSRFNLFFVDNIYQVRRFPSIYKTVLSKSNQSSFWFWKYFKYYWNLSSLTTCIGGPTLKQ